MIPSPARLWAQRKAWWRPPRTLRVTPTGRIFLIVTLGVGVGALNTGNNLLYLVLGALLSTIVVSGVLSERCLRGLRIRRLGAEFPFVGERFPFRYALQRPGGPAFALLIQESCPALRGEGRLAYLPAGKETTVRADYVADRRGPAALNEIKITTTYPLGLFAKSRTVTIADTLLVFPRRGFTCSLPQERGTSPLVEGGAHKRRDGQGELVGLRELSDGEAARQIHWKKSAAVGKLLRTEREREERRQFVLRVEGALGPALERECEEAAAQAHRLLEQGHEVGLQTQRTRLRPGTGATQERRILLALAWAGYEASS